MKPLFRWVGGKSRLVPEIAQLVGDSRGFTHYYEPFVGGGALFFALGRHADRCMIADINPHLVEAYRAVKENPDLVISIIQSLKDEPYAAIKHEFNSKPKIGTCRTAALFLMLMHLCFNGLYRVNKKGEFNVSLGTAAGKPRGMESFDYEGVLTASEALQRTRIKFGSFKDTMLSIEVVPGKTLVFCDPPYFQEFSNYDKSGFNASDHLKLCETARMLANEGAMVIVCGSDNAASRQIYGTPSKVVTLNRTVGASNRGKANECFWVFKSS